MNNFWILVKFEYKKILKRRLSWIFTLSVVLLAGLFTVISVNTCDIWSGESEGTRLQRIKEDRDIVRENKGYIDEQMIDKAIESNRKLISNQDNYIVNDYGKFITGNAYIKYILPYENVYDYLNVIYAKDLDSVYDDGLEVRCGADNKVIDSLTQGQIKDFNDDVKKFISSNIVHSLFLSADDKNANINLAEKINYPLYNDYYEGYISYIKSSVGLAVIVLFVLLIMLAPIFSREYEEGTDAVILCSKNGRSCLAKAKIFVVFTLSLVYSFIAMAISFLSYMAVYGFCGGKVNLQLLNPTNTYPVTLFKGCLIQLISIGVTAVSFTLFISFLSAKTRKKTLPIVGIGIAILIVPMFVRPSSKSSFIGIVTSLLPANTVGFNFDKYFIHIFGNSFTPYKVAWALGIVISAVFSVFAVRAFNKHQVG